jgi:hypothetical protein
MAACEEPPFAHTNVSDGLSEYTMTLEGIPDTLRGFGARFTAELVADPEVPSGFQRFFLSSLPTELYPYSDGTYVGQRRSAMPVTVTVIARLGAYVRQQQVVVYSHVNAFGLTCLSDGCGPLAALGHTLDIRVAAFVGGGAMGDLMYAFNNGRGEVVLRDTSVLEGVSWFGDGVPNYRVRARGNGESWVVFHADAARDSVLVSVRQVPVSWTVGCPSLVVGQSGQITATDPRDAGGRSIDEVFEINWVRNLEAFWTGDATVSPDGTVTALAPGTVYASGFLPAFPGRAAGTCQIEIR